jgi:hypothetical protein
MYCRSRKASLLFKSVLILFAIIGLGLQFRVNEGRFEFQMFNFFTVLSNAFNLVYFMMDFLWLYNAAPPEDTTLSPLAKGMSTLGVTLTMVIANTLLIQMYAMQTSTPQLVGVVIVHIIVPVMSVLDWLIFDKKGQIRVWHPLFWIILPYLYLGYAMIAAHIGQGISNFTGSRYPYPFLDVEKLGVPRVALSVVIITVIFIGLGYLAYFIDQWMARKAGTLAEKPADYV